MHHRTTLLRFAFVPFVAALCAVPACGSSNNSSSGATGGTGGGSSSGGTSSVPVDSGVEGGKTLTDLTPTEVQQLCDATEQAVDQVLSEESLCRIAGVMAGLGSESPATDCQTTEQECLAAPGETTTDCDVPPDCDITVGEYEACLGDALPVLGSALGAAPACEGLTEQQALPLVLGLFAALQQPSCAVVQDKCPELLPGAELGGETGFGGASPGFAGSSGL
jgi:hypothetical protein